MGCCGSVSDPNTYLKPHAQGKTLVQGLVGPGPAHPFTIEPWMTSQKTTPVKMLAMTDSQNQVVFSVSGKCHAREDSQVVDASGNTVAVLRTAQKTAPGSGAGFEQTSWLILGTTPRVEGQTPHPEPGYGQTLYLWAKLTRYPFTNTAKLFLVKQNGQLDETSDDFRVNMKIGLRPQKFEAWSSAGGAMVVDVKDKKYKVFVAEGADVALLYACTIAHFKMNDEIPQSNGGAGAGAM